MLRRLPWTAFLAATLSACSLSGCVIEEGCGHSLCGCAEDVTLTVSGQVVDADGAPIAAAEVRCADGAGSAVRTDAAGAFSFSVPTRRLESCAYTACDEITIRAPDGTSRTLGSDAANDLDAIVLFGAGAPDAG